MPNIEFGSGDNIGNSVVMASNSGLSMPPMARLEGSSNYSTWKVQMEMALVYEDLWQYTSKEPVTTDAGAVKADSKARAKIGMMLQPECLVHIRSAKSAKEAWEKLRTTFEDKGVNNRCRLLSRLVSLKLDQFSTVRAYVTGMLTIAQELRDIGKEVDDELLAALLLQGLTPEFQPLKITIENSQTALTSDYVKNKLYQMEDTYAASTSGSQTSTSALLTKKDTNKKGKISTHSTKKVLKCYICDGPHKCFQCPNKEKSSKHEAHQAFAFGTGNNQLGEDWVIDSGASTHMTKTKAWMKDLNKTPTPLRVMCADGREVMGEYVGKVVADGMTVDKVTYVPDLASNLLSVNAIAKKGYVLVFTEKECDIFKSDGCEVYGEYVGSGVEEKGIYKIKDCTYGTALSTTEGKLDDRVLWHRRMGHLGERNLKLLRDKMATGVSFSNCNCKLDCVSCVMGKQTRQPFTKNGTRATEVLGLVHTDVSGPMNVPSVSKNIYFVTFIDDFTRKTFVYFLKQKSEVFEKFQVFKAYAENQTGKKIKILRSDNGTEYVNKRMNDFLSVNGIHHQLTVDYTPEQNGVAERSNRTICEKARSMLMDSGLPQRFWAEAVHHAVYLKNRSPTIAVKEMTPEEKWTGKKCDLSNLRIFGCKALMHIPKQKRTKWDAKSMELVHTGFCDNAKAYRLIEPATGKQFKARDVVFLENSKYTDQEEPKENFIEFMVFPESEQEDVTVDMQTLPETNDRSDDSNLNTNVEEIEHRSETPRSDVEELGEPVNEVQEPESEEAETDTEFFEDCESINVPENSQPEVERRYPLRDRKPKEFPDYILYHAKIEPDPVTVREALSRKDSEKWKQAIQEELDALKKNGTWVLVKPQKSYNIVNSKWLFRIKEEAGNRCRHKARLVARGFSQRYGVDYDETFAPVVRHSSLRVLIAQAVQQGLQIDQMDVKTAFLNGELDETVYMKQPEGFEEKGKEDHVCLLKRSLYGLKQAPRTWNTKLDNELVKLGFERSKNEPCVYTRSRGNNVIILAVYVDDMLIFWNNRNELLKVKKDLMSKFEMKDLGKAELILGMQITQSDAGIKLDQAKYINKVLKNFGMEDCKPAATPAITGLNLSKPGPKHKSDPNIPYQNVIGSLMYLAVCTRPDIAYTVNYLSQFNSNYDESHWIAAKRVLRYLKGTKNFGLMYKQGTSNEMHCYADASHASTYDQRSYSGAVFLHMGAAVSWESKKQKTIALSTSEAEYVAMSEAAREAIFLKRFVAEIRGQAELPIKIFSDSQSAIAIAHNPVHHQRTKHIAVRHHFVREAVEHGHIELEYIQTERMVADSLTKPLPKGKFAWCTLSMGVV